MMRQFVLIFAALFLFARTASAQTGGQFCVRAFEDRNGNGTLDSGEPLLTSGVSADLLNAENIIVGSALLSESPNAAQGVICFQFLAPGQYTLILTSADFAATTPSTVTASIGDGSLPTVVEFGGQRLSLEPETQTGAPAAANPLAGLSDLASLERDVLPRVVLALLGSLLVTAGMIVLGSLIYLLFFRRPAALEPAYYPPASAATSGKMKPVEHQDDTDPV